MTAELVGRLRTALDQAEKLAEDASDAVIEWIGDDAAEHGEPYAGEYINAWKPSTVLRLIASHRALITDLTAVSFEVADAQRGLVPPEVRPLSVTAVERRILKREVERAAEFWLGPEATDADH